MLPRLLPPWRDDRFVTQQPSVIYPRLQHPEIILDDKLWSQGPNLIFVAAKWLKSNGTIN